jgi:hypothetical protein
MIPVYLKDPDFREPEESMYHLVTADGLFLVQKTALFSVARPTEGVPGLAGHEERLDLFFPRLSRNLVSTLYGFFLAVYRRWQSEAIALLYYSPGERAFRVGVPPQTIYRYRVRDGWATEGRVEYGYHARPEGFLKLGDIHSHADLPAFHSCTDDRDDREDGLHIVFGSLHREIPSVAASFVAGGRRYRLDADRVMEHFTSPGTAPAAWLERIACEYERPRAQSREAAR